MIPERAKVHFYVRSPSEADIANIPEREKN